MSHSALAEWETIERTLRGARHGLLLFDFDGTLTPIVARRHQARLKEPTRNILRALSKNRHFTVGIVSGRSLKQVRRLIGLPGLIYAGNHGLEIAGRGLRFKFEDGLQKTPVLRRMLKHLAEKLARIPGTEAEDKGLSASIHYRQMPRRHLVSFRRFLEEVVVPAAREHHFRLLAGKKSIDICPSLEWNKGRAVEWIRKHMPSGSVVLYAGDDMTDEDVFQRLGRRDIAIHLGNGGPTAARYRLSSPRGTQQLLERLAAL